MPAVPTVTPDGAEVRRRRKELGFTAREVARRAGDRAPSSITNIESGSYARVGLKFMAQLARVLRCKVGDITLTPGADEPDGREGAAAKPAA